ncbi:hypothetical protein AB0O34_32495 [Sphaerisporangium sp. NPDC088356]|uniref:hypothetical protein n=1 Tax=Sphaerisporangium sp. NPDC088356 TaxID=3154871 RepID=UPI0034169FDE
MRKGTTAISAGALTLALGGGTMLLAATPATASAPPPLRVADCDRGTDPLSSLTGQACDLLGGVTGTVNDLTGDKAAPVTDTLNHLTEDTLKPVADTVTKTAGELLGGTGNTSPTAGPPTATPAPSAEPSEASNGNLLGADLDTGCLPLVSAPDCGQAKPSAAPKSPAGQDRSIPTHAPAAPAPSAGPREQASPPPPRPAASPGQGTLTGGTNLGDVVERAGPSAPPSTPPSADVESPPLMPLWPGQPLPSLDGRLNARKVMPSRPYDVVGTALTAALLASAILATRIVQARRVEDKPQSMPFEGLRRPDTGRHRLA